MKNKLRSAVFYAKIKNVETGVRRNVYDIRNSEQQHR